MYTHISEHSKKSYKLNLEYLGLVVFPFKIILRFIQSFKRVLMSGTH